MKTEFDIKDGVLEHYRKDLVVKIPEGVSEIYYGAFENRGIEKVILPEGLTKIGNFAFSGCKFLKEINFPSSLKEIGNSAFKWCVGLNRVSLPGGVKIGKEAFRNSGLLELKQNGADVRHTRAFQGTSLIRFQNRKEDETGLVVVEDIVFDLYSDKRELSIPEGIKGIETGAICDMDELEIMKLPDSFEYIDEYAFDGCNALKRIKCSMEMLCNSGRIFKDCPCLEDENGFVIVDGVLKLLAYSSEQSQSAERYIINTIILPDTVEIIGKDALNICDMNYPFVYEELIIPDSVKKIHISNKNLIDMSISARLPKNFEWYG